MVITIMGVVSQWERESIAERTREALRHKGSKRECIGNIGYGLRLSADGVHVEECPREQGVLSEIRRLRSEGATMRGIASTLNTRGYRTRRGSDWRLESVARVLNNTAV